MSRVTTFEDLQHLGANTIHEHTHIARSKLELLLSKSFSELNRVQFMGFVSILEREYSIDLSDLREEYDHYLHANPQLNEAKPSVILQAPSHQRKIWVIGAIVAVMVLIGIAVTIQQEVSILPKDDVMVLPSSTITVQEVNETQEINTTAEANTSELNSSQSNEHNVTLTSANFSSVASVVQIVPLSTVWVGTMELKSGIKNQKVTKEPIVVDATKEWLFILGHGRLRLESSEGNKTLNDRNRVYFSYEQGQLRQLSHEQFRSKKQRGKLVVFRWIILLIFPLLLSAAEHKATFFITIDNADRIATKVVFNAMQTLGQKVNFQRYDRTQDRIVIEFSTTGTRPFEPKYFGEIMNDNTLKITKASVKKSHWMMNLDGSNVRWNLSAITPDEGAQMEKERASSWFLVDQSSAITIEAPYNGKWYPDVAVLDANMEVLSSLREFKAHERLTFSLPQGAVYMKVSSTNGMKLLKEGMWIEHATE